MSVVMMIWELTTFSCFSKLEEGTSSILPLPSSQEIISNMSAKSTTMRGIMMKPSSLFTLNQEGVLCVNALQCPLCKCTREE